MLPSVMLWSPSLRRLDKYRLSFLKSGCGPADDCGIPEWQTVQTPHKVPFVSGPVNPTVTDMSWASADVDAGHAGRDDS